MKSIGSVFAYGDMGFQEKLNGRIFTILNSQRLKSEQDKLAFDILLLTQAQKKYGATGPGIGASLILGGGQQ